MKLMQINLFPSLSSRLNVPRGKASSSLSGSRSRCGFSLIELLVVIAIIGAFGGLAYAMGHSASGTARRTKEIAAGRNLATAYQVYANENGGRYMLGYDRNAQSVALPNRTVSFMEAPVRYPWRIVPYLEYNLEGTILLNGNEEQIEEVFGDRGSLYDYGVSLRPALGMNDFFVGGIAMSRDGSLEPSQRGEVIQTLANFERIIVFASAGQREINIHGEYSPEEMVGYYRVTAPNCPIGTEWPAEGPVENIPPLHGNVSFRHGGKAVCAFLDGSVETLGIDELRDMRLWSRNAVRSDLADYQPNQ